MTYTPTIVTGDASNVIAVSHDGTTWATHPWTGGYTWCVGYAPDTGTFVAGAGNNGVSRSTDGGVTWSALAATGYHFSAAGGRGIAYSTSLHMFIALGYVVSGFVNSYFTSTDDGVTWTAHTLSNANSVAWIARLGLFMITTSAGTLLTSPDGVTWTTLTPPSGGSALWDIDDNGSLLVMAGNSGRINTSPDGITWTARTSGFAASTNLARVAWSAALGRWLVSGDGGVTTTSADGITWTTGMTLPVQPSDLVWDADLGIYLIGYGGSVYTSPDGTTWTLRLSGSSDAGIGISTQPPSTLQPIVSRTDVTVALADRAALVLDAVVAETTLTVRTDDALAALIPHVVIAETTVAVQTHDTLAALILDAVVAETDVRLAGEVDLVLDAILAGTDVAVALAGQAALAPDVIVAETGVRIMYVPDLSDNAPVLVGFASHARIDTVDAGSDAP